MTDSLIRGHRKFRREYAGDERGFLESLASKGQSLDALYIGCSDSRVVPELLTSSRTSTRSCRSEISSRKPDRS